MAVELSPVRSVTIEGAVARARVLGADRPPVEPTRLGPIDTTPQFRSVRDASDVDREVGNPADQHCCPLCEEYFGWEAFKAHAQQCINARAPRTRVWTPPGMLANPIQSFADKVRPPKGA